MLKLRKVQVGLLIALAISATVTLPAYAKPMASNDYAWADLTFTCSNCYAYQLQVHGTMAYIEGPYTNYTWTSLKMDNPANNWNPRYAHPDQPTKDWEIYYAWDMNSGVSVSFLISGNGTAWSHCTNKIKYTNPYMYVHITWSHGKATSGTCGVSSSNYY